MGKYCITQDLTNYKSDTQISQNCLKKTWFSAAKMLHRLLQPVSRETFFVVIYRIAAVFTVFFAVYFLFFRLYGKFFLAMEQKKLLVIVNGNYQRIMDCREAFRPNRPKKRLRWNIWSKYNEWNGSCDFVIYYQRLKYFTLPFYSLSQGWDGTPYQPQDIWHFALAISTFLALFVPCHYLSVVIRVHIWLLRTPGRGKFLIRVYMSWSTRYFCVSLGFCHIFVSFLIVIIYYLELLSFYFSIHFLLLSYICRDLFCLPLLSFLSLS